MEEELCACVDCVPSNHTSLFFDVNKCDVKGTPKEKWLDTDIRALITRWKSKEILCDPTHASYHNMKERLQAVEEIRDELANEGMNFTIKQVSDKMTNLRTYYGSQKRLIDASKRQDSENSNDVFVSRWKYFESLSFLSNTIISRSSATNEHCSNGSDIYSSNKRNHSPTLLTMHRASKRIRNFYPVTSIKNIKSVPDNTTAGGDDNPTTMFYSNDDVNSTSSDVSKSNEQFPRQHQFKSLRKEAIVDNTPAQLSVETNKTQDQIFGELISKMLSDIPDAHNKAMLKLEIQHKIVCLQYNTNTPKKFALSQNTEDN